MQISDTFNAKTKTNQVQKLTSGDWIDSQEPQVSVSSKIPSIVVMINIVRPTPNFIIILMKV